MDNCKSKSIGAIPMGSITVIILCHNEEKNLLKFQQKIDEIHKELSKLGKCEILFEEDGSTDRSREIIMDHLKYNPDFKGIFNDDRLGKGGGFIFGVKEVNTDYVLLTDADLPIRVEDYSNLFRTISQGYDIVYVDRRHKDSVTDIPRKRKFFSRIFNLLINGLFFLNIGDTQCGVKAFRRKKLPKVLPKYSKRFAMDVEILYRAKHQKMRLIGIPVHYTHGSDSKISLFKDGYNMFLEVLDLRWKTLKEK